MERGREGQIEVKRADVVRDEQVNTAKGSAEVSSQLAGEAPELGRGSARRALAAEADDTRVPRVDQRDPDQLNPRVGRSTAADDDSDVVASVGEQPGMRSEDRLNATNDRRSRVVQQGDPAGHESTSGAEAVDDEVRDVTLKDRE